MISSVVRIPLKPSSCTLGFGIPTSLREYDRQKKAHESHGEDHENHDFIFSVERNHYPAVFRFDRFLPEIAATGARIEPVLTLEKFGALLGEQVSVLTLFAHQKDDRVEFADGLATIPQIVEAVPRDYVGILDLCVCQSPELARRLRYERSNIALIRYIEKAATPWRWLWFYLILFKILQTENSSWPNAFDKTLKAFLIPSGT